MEWPYRDTVLRRVAELWPDRPAPAGAARHLSASSLRKQGPIRRVLSGRVLASDAFFTNNDRCGLWVPAFAGTTDGSKQQTRLRDPAAQMREFLLETSR